MQLFGSQRVFQQHRHEQLWRKKRQASELQVAAIGDGVAQLHATVGGETNDVACKRFFNRFAPLAEKRHHRRRAQFLGAALHFEFHAGRVFARGHSNKRNSVAVIGIHVGLHFEHHARKTAVFGLHGFFHHLLVDQQRALASLGKGCQVHQRIEHFHHPKIVDPGTKKNRRLLATQKSCSVK